MDPGFRSVDEPGRRHPSPAQRGDQHRAHPEVAFVAATTGATNLVASVVCRDVRALYRYLTERLATLPAIRSIETTPIIRTLKGAGTMG